MHILWQELRSKFGSGLRHKPAYQLRNPLPNPKQLLVHGLKQIDPKVHRLSLTKLVVGDRGASCFLARWRRTPVEPFVIGHVFDHEWQAIAHDLFSSGPTKIEEGPR